MKPTPVEWNGLPIANFGIYSGVDISTYHGQLTTGPSISKSGLWEIVKPDGSLAHYFDTSYLNPEAEPWEESEALILGRGAHHLLLGESDFHKHFAIRPEEYPADGGSFKPWNGNSKWCKQWLEVEARAGRTVLKPDHIERIKGMSRTLAEHPMVGGEHGGILNGLVEHSLVYRDPETGVWIKVRPDVVPTDDLDVSDLKTCASVSDRAIDNAIADFGYHVQGALIRMAFENVLGVVMNSFSLVFVESKRPHCVRVVTVSDEDLELGEKLARAGLRLFAKGLETGVWPGPGGTQADAVYASMPDYARRRQEARLLRMDNELHGL